MSENGLGGKGDNINVQFKVRIEFGTFCIITNTVQKTRFFDHIRLLPLISQRKQMST